MSRDRELLEECRALQRAVAPHPTHTALVSSPEWPTLAPRFQRVLGLVRRVSPAHEPPATTRPDVVRVVHWNIEHGNRYDAIERALVGNPALADADVIALNEVDLGMARAGNRDVTRDLAVRLTRHGVWTPLFLETTRGRDDDPSHAGARTNEESLFGIALLTRWPIGAVRVVELPSPVRFQFDRERMFGRHVGLIAEVLRPGRAFVAATAHLEVHRGRAERAAQMGVVLEALADEKRPVVLTGDFNSHTFDRGRRHASLDAARALFFTPGHELAERFRHPDRGPHHEPMFDLLRAEGFEWETYTDFEPTLGLRFERVEEGRAWDWLSRIAGPLVTWAVSRGALKLDWIAGRGWAGGLGRTVTGLDGAGRPSDHAPIVAELAVAPAR
jgi:endonuclease/exonuclease/phosphatase family metal-dependent hydrolase